MLTLEYSPQVIISYSRKNTDELIKLKAKLDVLKKFENFEVWTDRDIGYGEDWLAEIENKFKSCDIAILLISDDFFGSDFIMDKEIPLLLNLEKENRIKIIPLMLAPSLWEDIPWFRKLNGFPPGNIPLSDMNDNDQEKTLVEFSKEIKNSCIKIKKERAKDNVPKSKDINNLEENDYFVKFSKEHFIKMGYEIKDSSPRFQILNKNIFEVHGIKKYTIIPVLIDERRAEYIKKLEGVLFWKYRKLIWNDKYHQLIKEKFSLTNNEFKDENIDYRIKVKIVDEWRKIKANSTRISYSTSESIVFYLLWKNPPHYQKIEKTIPLRNEKNYKSGEKLSNLFLNLAFMPNWWAVGKDDFGVIPNKPYPNIAEIFIEFSPLLKKHNLI